MAILGNISSYLLSCWLYLLQGTLKDSVMSFMFRFKNIIKPLIQRQKSATHFPMYYFRNIFTVFCISADEVTF